MEIKELRIGNFLYELLDGVTPGIDLFVVAGINSLTNTLIDVNDNITQIDYCAPIPLTEEWLFRIGFKRERSSFSNNSITNRITISDSHTPDFKYICRNYDVIGSIYYVHQLQNWIHTLTGSELTIKELV